MQQYVKSTTLGGATLLWKVSKGSLPYRLDLELVAREEHGKVTREYHRRNAPDLKHYQPVDDKTAMRMILSAK